MNRLQTADPDVSSALLDAITAFPVHREVTHCGHTFAAPPFDVYADCPTCGRRLKVRSFAAVPELEDVFDAVFAWMARPEAAEAVRHRQSQLAADET